MTYMDAGFSAQGRGRRRVVGIQTAAKTEMTREAVLKIAKATAALVESKEAITPDDLIVDPRYAGPSYGVPSAETIEAIQLGGSLRR